MTTDQRAKLAYMEGQMKLCELRAMGWLAKIQSGAAVRRNMSDGNGRQLTDAEKVDRAIESFQAQLRWFEDALDARDELIREIGE